MSSGELLLTFLVALVVFGPKKLPILAFHLGKAFTILNRFKQQAYALWQEQANQHQLEQNILKAKKAEHACEPKSLIQKEEYK